jgi:acyl-CoA synthetase (AMP-forming)/AMP-acid ligase II
MAQHMLEAASLWELIERRAQETPDAPMVIDESRQTLTFANYRDAAERRAAGLHAYGIREGTVVTWILPTTNEAFVLVGALARVGAIQNPVLPIYREREVRFIVEQCKPGLLIVPSVYRNFDFEAMARQIVSDDRLLVADRGLPEGDPSSLPPFAGGDEVRWLFYTSGSTADPKGAQHTDANIIATARGMGKRLGMTPDDRNGLAFPFTHIAGPIWLATGLMYGHCHLIVAAFDPTTTIPFFREH